MRGGLLRLAGFLVCMGVACLAVGHAQMPMSQAAYTPSPSSGGGIALVAHTGADNFGTTVTTSAINTTGANLIVVAICTVNNLTGATVTDSKSNTWSSSLTAVSGGNLIQIFYLYSPTVGSGHTFTFTTSGGPTTPSIAVAAFSGTLSPFDQQMGATQTGAISTFQAGSITPTANNELIIAQASNYSTSTVSINDGFTITDSVSPLYNTGNTLAYLVQTTAAAINPTWTYGTAQTYASAKIASFK